MKRANFSYALCAVVGGMVLFGGVASAQTVGYMRVTDSRGQVLPGESNDAAHKGWIEIQRAALPGSAGAASTTTARPGSKSASTQTPSLAPATSTGQPEAMRSEAAKPANPRVVVAPGAVARQGVSKPGTVTLVKRVDKTSASFRQALISGQRLREVVIDLRHADDQGHLYERWRLEDVLVSSIQVWSNAGGDRIPSEQITLAFARSFHESF